MPRPISIALIAIFCLTLTARAEDKLPPAVKRVLDRAVGKVRANRQEFDKANEKPLSEARQELQDLSTKLIKDGKTEEAGVVLKQVGTLEADVMRMANAPVPFASGGGPQRPLMERLAGKWTEPSMDTYVDIRADGSMKHVYKASGKGGWESRLVLVEPEVAEATWQNGVKSRYHLSGKDVIAVLDVKSDGSPDRRYVLERLR